MVTVSSTVKSGHYLAPAGGGGKNTMEHSSIYGGHFEKWQLEPMLFTGGKVRDENLKPQALKAGFDNTNNTLEVDVIPDMDNLKWSGQPHQAYWGNNTQFDASHATCNYNPICGREYKPDSDYPNGWGTMKAGSWEPYMAKVATPLDEKSVFTGRYSNNFIMGKPSLTDLLSGVSLESKRKPFTPVVEANYGDLKPQANGLAWDDKGLTCQEKGKWGEIAPAYRFGARPMCGKFIDDASRQCPAYDTFKQAGLTTTVNIAEGASNTAYKPWEKGRTGVGLGIVEENAFKYLSPYPNQDAMRGSAPWPHNNQKWNDMYFENPAVTNTNYPLGRATCHYNLTRASLNNVVKNESKKPATMAKWKTFFKGIVDASFNYDKVDSKKNSSGRASRKDHGGGFPDTVAYGMLKTYCMEKIPPEHCKSITRNKTTKPKQGCSRFGATSEAGGDVCTGWMAKAYYRPMLAHLQKHKKFKKDELILDVLNGNPNKTAGILKREFETEIIDKVCANPAAGSDGRECACLAFSDDRNTLTKLRPTHAGTIAAVAWDKIKSFIKGISGTGSGKFCINADCGDNVVNTDIWGPMPPQGSSLINVARMQFGTWGGRNEPNPCGACNVRQFMNASNVKNTGTIKMEAKVACGQAEPAKVATKPGPPSEFRRARLVAGWGVALALMVGAGVGLGAVVLIIVITVLGLR